MTHEQLSIIKILSMSEKRIYIFFNKTDDIERKYIFEYEDYQYTALYELHKIIIKIFLSKFYDYDDDEYIYHLIKEMKWMAFHILINEDIPSHLVSSCFRGEMFWAILRRYSNLILSYIKCHDIVDFNICLKSDAEFDITEVKISHFEKLINMYWRTNTGYICGLASNFYNIELKEILDDRFKEVIAIYDVITVEEENIYILKNLEILSIDNAFLFMDEINQSFFPIFKCDEYLYGIIFDKGLNINNIHVFSIKDRVFNKMNYDYVSFIISVFKAHLNDRLINGFDVELSVTFEDVINSIK